MDWYTLIEKVMNLATSLLTLLTAYIALKITLNSKGKRKTSKPRKPKK